MDIHMDGAWDTFSIKAQNDTFIALQMKKWSHLAPQNSKFHSRVKKCHFGHFPDWDGPALHIAKVYYIEGYRNYDFWFLQTMYKIKILPWK